MSIKTRTSRITPVTLPSRSHQLEAAPDGPVQIQAPESYQGGDWAHAHELAVCKQQPVFVPITPFADDRGWSLMNLLSGVLTRQGQVNFSAQYPGVVKAWHRHQQQSDFWLCVAGQIKAGVYREEDGAAWMIVTGERRPGVLIIPPSLWHGAACVGPTPSGLVYFVTRAYDPAQPDEQRRPWDSVEGFPWTTRHG